jgi:histidinol-phosphate/aromatic aminotransferase/cobyric acid decarboxylase-like protein
LRYFGGDLADCVRITVGKPAENDRLLESMSSMEVSDV